MILTWNFGGGPSKSVLVFFKMASAKGYFLYENTFDVVLAIIEADILYNDGIMSTNVFFEAVEKSNAPCVINVCLLKGKQVGHIQVVDWTHST